MLQKKKNNTQYLLVVALSMLVASCANVVTPTGGQKDVLPPVPVSATPKNHSVNFNTPSVKITFDEFIKLKDIGTQFMMSPLQENPPEIKEKGHSVIIELKDKALPNTTYTLSFGNSITDITEGNYINNYQYVFSTGETLDSLSVKGYVKNAFDLKPEDGVYVMLYDKNIDSLPIKSRPQYICRTNPTGVFEINNVRSGQYKIFALKDVNSNYLFDQPNEKIAFLDQQVIPEIFIIPKKDSLNKKDSLKKNTYTDLFLFEEPDTLQRLVKSNVSQGKKLTFIFKQSTRNLELRSLRPLPIADWKIDEFCQTKDTLSCWLKLSGVDSLFIEVKDHGKILDTVEFSLAVKSGRQGRGESNLEKLFFSTNVIGNGIFNLNAPFIINFSSPLQSFDFSKIIFNEEKEIIKPDIHFKGSVQRVLQIDYKWKEETNYSLFIPPGAFTDIFAHTSDTISVKFKTKALKNYGTLKLKLDVPLSCSNYILQLCDEQDKVMQEQMISSSQTIKLEYLNPANYKLKVIFDKNNNKKWDSGRYLLKLQPEKVIYYPGTISVKANWDLEQEWIITE
jgi:hypothetical protein